MAGLARTLVTKFIKSFLIFLIFLLLGASLIVIFFGRKEKKVRNLLSPILTPILSSQQEASTSSLNFSLENSPINAVRGAITELKGSVLWKSRTVTESAALSPSTQIQQGEEVETKEAGSLTIEFGEGRSIQIFPKSGLNIVQTLPDNLVFQQTEGAVIYKNSSGSPLAIRSLGLLTQFTAGEAKIAINKKTSTITVEANKGTLNSAYNDLKYVTRVVLVNEGRTFTFNNIKKRALVKTSPYHP